MRSAPHVRLVGALVSGAALAIIVATVFAPAADGRFVYDDVRNVIENPWVREPGRWVEAFCHHMAAFSSRFETSYYRPLMHVLLAGVYAAHGLDPRQFHLLLVVLHGLATVLVLALLNRFTRPAQNPSWAVLNPGAVAGALLFAVHPVHVEAVAWISGVVDLSAALLATAAILALTSSQRWVNGLLGPVLLLAAMLGKEPAVMVVPALIVLTMARTRVGQVGGVTPVAWTGVAVAIGLYLGLRVLALGGLMGTGSSRRVQVGLVEWPLTAIALYGEYVRLLLWPTGLSAIHDFEVVRSPLTPGFIGGLAALGATALITWKARRDPPVLFGIALVVLTLLPALYVPVLGPGLVAERYLYLPSVGAALLAALAWDRWPVTERSWAWVRATVFAAAVAAATLQTVGRVPAWHDDIALWSDAASKVPNSWTARANLGAALLAAGRSGEAVEALRLAVAWNPADVDARSNLSLALSLSGQPGPALAEASDVIRRDPRSAQGWGMRGFALYLLGRKEEAVSDYRRAIGIEPGNAVLHNSLAVVLAESGAIDEAERHFQEAVNLDPGNADYRQRLAIVRSLKAGAPMRQESK